MLEKPGSVSALSPVMCETESEFGFKSGSAHPQAFNPATDGRTGPFFAHCYSAPTYTGVIENP